MIKKNILRLSLVAVAVTAIAFSNFSVEKKKASPGNASLGKFLTINNANAEGGINCGSKGSGCKYSINGIPVVDKDYKEAGH